MGPENSTPDRSRGSRASKGREGIDAPRPAAWFPKAAALLIGCSLALALAEVTARVARVGYGNSPIIAHPVYHHTHPTNHATIMWSRHDEFGGFEVHFNADGLASEYPTPGPGIPTVAFLGDSFVEGLTVREEQRAITLVQEELGLACTNLGVSSFGPLLARLRFEAIQERINTQAVVLTLYCNDIANTWEYQSLAIRNDDGRIVAVPGKRDSIIKLAARRLHAARYLRMVYLRYMHSREDRVAGIRGNEGATWEPSFEQPISELHEADVLQAFESSLCDLRELLAELDIPLLVTVIPDRGSLAQDKPDYYSQYVSSLFAGTTATFVDVGAIFAERGVRSLFFEHDIHLTPKGNVALADGLAPALRAALGDGSTSEVPHERVVRARN